MRSQETAPEKLFHIYASSRIGAELFSDVQLRKAGCHFSSEAQWARIARDMPMSRLVAIWNGLPHVAPVQRFTSRAVALRRIWKAIQTIKPKQGRRLPAFGIEGKSKAPRVFERARGGAGTRSEQVIALLETEDGVSLNQLASAMGWQKHSVRGYLSAIIRRKMGINIISVRNDDGTRVYRIAPGE